MGFIHCCGALRKSKSFEMKPEADYMLCELDYLDSCPVCGHTVIQLTRIDFSHRVSVCRKVNSKAVRFFKKIKPLIIEEKVYTPKINHYGKFYLNYNEFGVKKRCYSNLSALKLGLFENKNLI